MDKKHPNNANGNNVGFLLGAVAGAGLALLLTTKKGKEILKILAEEGIEKIADWEKFVKDAEQALEDDDGESGSDYIKQLNDSQASSEPEANAEDVPIVEVPVQPLDVSESPVAEPAKDTSSSENNIEENVQKASTEKVEYPGTMTKVKSTARRFFKRKK